MNIRLNYLNIFITLVLSLTLIYLIYLIVNLNKNQEVKLKDFDNYLNEPIIFIGGSMSSGTSLIRAILDVHPDVNCGPETKFIHLSLKFMEDLFNNDKTSMKFMSEAGVKNETVKKSIGILIYYMILSNSDTKPKRMCDKEPSNRFYIDYFKNIFPNSKFVYIVRDGRDMAYSYMKRVTVKRNFATFLRVLQKWDEENQIALDKCIKTGPDYCLLIKYENFVNNPEKEIRKITKFLNLKWTERFLNHEKYINTEIKISKTEWSLRNLKKKINNESIGQWIGKYENYDANLVKEKFPMLTVLKYV